MVAALRRFIARRGQILSDNATKFVGARRDLNAFDEGVRAGVQSYGSLEWLFIPPRSPNFGVLWEAAVKSMKHHLRSVMGNCILDYEEMTTILCQMKQVLNNRPLMALTKLRSYLCDHSVNDSQWQPIGCYPTTLLTTDGCPRASIKTISQSSTATSSILVAMVI